MASGDPVVEAATALVAAARAGGGEARVLGGIGVALRCPSARPGGPLARAYSDLDLVTTRKAAPRLAQAMEQLGYVPERRFNAVHGHARMMFAHPEGAHVDVFVDQFVMCHRLDLTPRLALHDTTVPLADLLLTKLQVAELNEKDVTDAAALLLDHELTRGEPGIDLDYVTGVLGRDWGWWRTVTHNLQALPAHLGERLPGDAASQVSGRLDKLVEAIERAPKGLRWKARAKAGERIPWREDPEESH